MAIQPGILPSSPGLRSGNLTQTGVLKVLPWDFTKQSPGKAVLPSLRLLVATGPGTGRWRRDPTLTPWVELFILPWLHCCPFQCRSALRGSGPLASSVLTRDDCKHFKHLNNVLQRSKLCFSLQQTTYFLSVLYFLKKYFISVSFLHKNPSIFLEFCSFKFFPFLFRFTTSPASSHQSDTASHFLVPSNPTICYVPQDLGDAHGKRQQQHQLKPAQRKMGFSSCNGAVLAFTDYWIGCRVCRQDSGSSHLGSARGIPRADSRRETGKLGLATPDPHPPWNPDRKLSG